MELNHLQVFFEVAKSGSFTLAAQKLNISQSALSRSVSLLEESEGVRLLERSKRGVAMTPTGLEVFRHCEQLFHSVHEIHQVCRGRQTELEGTLSFAAVDHVVSYLLPEALRTFRTKHPKVIPSISIGTADEILERQLLGHCEFTLSFAKVAAPQVLFESLREEPMALVVNAGVWKRFAGTGTPHLKLHRVLQQVGYISSVGAHVQSRPSRVLKELFGQMPPISVEVNGQEAQKRICLASGGIAYLAHFMVRQEIESGLLHEINMEQTHAFKLWLATRRGQELSAAGKAFIEHLRGA